MAVPVNMYRDVSYDSEPYTTRPVLGRLHSYGEQSVDDSPLSDYLDVDFILDEVVPDDQVHGRPVIALGGVPALNGNKRDPVVSIHQLDLDWDQDLSREHSSADTPSDEVKNLQLFSPTSAANAPLSSDMKAFLHKRRKRATPSSNPSYTSDCSLPQNPTSNPPFLPPDGDEINAAYKFATPQSQKDFAARRRSMTPPSDSNEDSLSPQQSAEAITLAAPNPTNSRKRQKLPHTQVEKRYRENLNAHFDTLRKVVPSGRLSPTVGSGGRISDAGTAMHCGSKSSKAEVIAGAISYIKMLESENSALWSEVQVLQWRCRTLQQQQQGGSFG